jgi:F-type H+-transporting ATPase subunit b
MTNFRAARQRLSAIAAAFVLFSCVLGTPPVLLAQQSGQNEITAAETPGNPPPKDEDQTEQFKHSASVRWLGKITGLNPEEAYWLAVILNFAVVAGAIIWVSKKNLPAVFRNRTLAIQRALEEARRTSEEARQRLSQIEARLSRLDEEIRQMRANSEKEAAAEESRIKATTEEDARRIVESAEQEIAASAKAARRDLTAYAADLAVSLASQQIHVDSTADQKLVRRFAQQLSNGGSGKSS